MGKALEILTRLRQAKSDDENYPTDYEIQEVIEELKAKNERIIKELEEAMKPKTCEGCKQSWKPNNQTFHKYFCEYLQMPIHGGFCCNKHEPKIEHHEFLINEE